MQIKQLVKNKVFFYLFSRYFTYFIQFVTSLIVAVKLGPYYMGIWGFILLVLNFFQQVHFGIANSFNVLYVHHRENPQKCKSYILNSLILLVYLAILVCLCYVYYVVFGIDSFEKYCVDRYVGYICLIAILQYFLQFFINLFRVKNQLGNVMFCQSIVVFLNFTCVFFFRNEMLIHVLLVGHVVGNVLCMLLAVVSGNIPRLRKKDICVSLQKEILKKGLFLFLYNSCFYFILISIRALISEYYSVEEFGLFSFSFTLAHAILLVLEAFAFIVYPKVLGKLSSDSVDTVLRTIKSLRSIYITLTHLLIYIALILVPFLFNFMPQYSASITSFYMVALTILISCNSYGFLDVLIARNLEKVAAKLSAFALIMNCSLAYVFVSHFYVPYSYVIIATLLTYLLFSLGAIVYGMRCIGQLSFLDIFRNWIPPRLFISYFMTLAIILVGCEEFIYVPLTIFIVLNWRVIAEIKTTISLLMKSPEIVNLK